MEADAAKKVVNPDVGIDEVAFRDSKFSMAVKETVKVCIDPIAQQREGKVLERVLQKIQEEESKKNLK